MPVVVLLFDLDILDAQQFVAAWHNQFRVQALACVFAKQATA
ncbi:MAG TPA: hypothetical protein VGO68_16925 [Pyrinomonadaceae bacterium]|jgi:hypothetical protein|nr:hypothetical protein [Pyrinomonadaceae bacterium]